MKIRDFGVEIWMNHYETRCELNLAETCVESLTLGALLAMAGRTGTFLGELLPMKLTYGEIEGSQRLRGLVAGLYERQAPEFPEYDRPGRAAATSTEADDSTVSAMVLKPTQRPV